jgi:hypothetical protein
MFFSDRGTREVAYNQRSLSRPGSLSAVPADAKSHSELLFFEACAQDVAGAQRAKWSAIEYFEFFINTEIQL